MIEVKTEFLFIIVQKIYFILYTLWRVNDDTVYHELDIGQSPNSPTVNQCLQKFLGAYLAWLNQHWGKHTLSLLQFKYTGMMQFHEPKRNQRPGEFNEYIAI